MRNATESQMSYLATLVDKAIANLMDRTMKPEQRATMEKVNVQLRIDALAQAAADKRRASELIDAARTGYQSLGREVVGVEAWPAYVTEHGA